MKTITITIKTTRTTQRKNDTIFAVFTVFVTNTATYN